MQKSKMAVWGGLTNSCEKKRSEKQRRRVAYKDKRLDEEVNYYIPHLGKEGKVKGENNLGH